MATPEELRIRISAQNDTKQPIAEVRKDLAWLRSDFKKTETAAVGAGNSLSGMGRKAGSAGIQIQQLVGQIQGGTNPMLALSQQAADLGFVLGAPLLGAVGGLAASLAMVLLPALFSTTDAFEELKKAAKDSETTIRKIAPVTTQKKLDELNKTLGEGQEELAKLEAKYNKTVAAKARFEKGTENERRSAQLMQADIEAQAIAIELQASRNQRLQKTIEDLNGTTEEKLAQDQAELNLQRIFEDEDRKRADERKARALEKARLEDKLRREQASAETAEQAKFTQRLLDQLNAEDDAYNKQLAKRKEMAELKLAQDKAAQAEYDKMLQESEKYLKPVEDGLMALVTGSKDVAESFSDMARSVINDLIRMQIQASITKPLAGMLTDAGGLSGILGNLFGSTPATNIGAPASIAASAGAITHNALGGAVSAGEPTIVGEHGREMFVPNTNGAIIPTDKMGGGATIVQNINISTGVQQTVRTEIMQLLPQIANASKAAVLDAKKRGGSFGAAFGA
jgi:hypothetical protein